MAVTITLSAAPEVAADFAEKLTKKKPERFWITRNADINTEVVKIDESLTSKLNISLGPVL